MTAIAEHSPAMLRLFIEGRIVRARFIDAPKPRARKAASVEVFNALARAAGLTAEAVAAIADGHGRAADHPALWRALGVEVKR